MRRMESPDQMPLLYRCPTCRCLVPYPQAQNIAPWSWGDNSTLHHSCTRAAMRWFGRPHLNGRWNLDAETWEWIDAKAAP